MPSLCVLGPKKVPGLYQQILVKVISRMEVLKGVCILKCKNNYFICAEEECSVEKSEVSECLSAGF